MASEQRKAVTSRGQQIVKHQHKMNGFTMEFIFVHDDTALSTGKFINLTGCGQKRNKKEVGEVKASS